MKKFKDLVSKMPPQSRARVEARTKELLEGITLDELRGNLEITQEQLAERMHVDQSAISKLERRQDMHLSKLRDVVEALGGKLEIYASFPDGNVKLNPLRNVSRALSGVAE